MKVRSYRVRRLAVVVAALALGTVLTAPAGAWPDPSPGRQDGVGAGSMPPAAVQQYLAERPAVRGTSGPPTKVRPRAGNCLRPAGLTAKAKRACRSSALRARAVDR
jgi:hypothetical protein